MNKDLLAFLKAYLVWVDAGAVETPGSLTRRYGLCGNVSNYVYGLSAGRSSDDLLDRLYSDLIAAFRDDDLDTAYPFGQDRFNDDLTWHNHHLHAPRMAWVREKVKQFS